MASSISTGLLVLVLCIIATLSTALSNTTSNSTTAWRSPGLDVSSGEKNASTNTNTDMLPGASSSSIAGGLGGFVAAGLGMTSLMDTTTHGETATMAISTAIPRSKDTMTTATALTSTSAIISDPFSAYRNVSFTGQCLDQWNSYWTVSSSLSEGLGFRVYTSTTVVTSLYTDYTWDWSSPDWSSWTTTTTVFNGAFAQTTLTTVREISVAKSWPESTYATTSADEIYSTSSFDMPAITAPACLLPDYVPACQSSWEAWISRDPGEKPFITRSCKVYESVQPSSCLAPLSKYSSMEDRWDSIAYQSTPACKQAAITGSYCSQTISEYLDDRSNWSKQSDGVMGIGEGVRWPAMSELVPGCTLGCQACQINGGTVQLFYWPPMSSTWIDGFYSAITGNSTAKSTIVTLGTTLTSPTVYVSFDSLYARDSCTPFGTTYYNEIVAITDTATLSSIDGWRYDNQLGYSASFNFTDLYVTPVPNELYQRQPRCVSSRAMIMKAGPLPDDWACPRDTPYEPILAIPAEVRHIDPGWAGCKGSLNGVYDPPIALTPADSIAKPTFSSPDAKVTTKAVPASSPKSAVAPITFSSQAQVSSNTGSPKPSPESYEKPSQSQAIDVTNQPDDVINKHTQDEDGLDNGRLSSMMDSDRPVTPTRDDAIRHSRATRPAKPDAELSGTFTGEESSTGKNALSVLSEALTSVEAAVPANFADLAQSSHDETFSSDASPPTATPDLFTVALADGGSATAQAGEVLTIGSQPISVNAGGSELVLGTTTFAIPAKADTASSIDDFAVTTHPADGQRLIAFAEANGDAILVQQGSSSRFTLTAGEQTVVNGETMSAAQTGGALVVINATRTVSLPLLAATSGAMGNSESSSAGSSGVGEIVPDSMSKTADGGGASSSTSTPEAEILSGGVGRGSIGSVRGLSLFVFVVACVGLL